MNAAIVATFKHPVPGREHEALAYAREVDEYWRRMAAEGRCTDPEWFWATRGPNLWIVKGDADVLYGLLAGPESQRLLNKGRLLVQDFEYDLHLYGRDEGLKPFEEAFERLHAAA